MTRTMLKTKDLGALIERASEIESGFRAESIYGKSPYRYTPYRDGRLIREAFWLISRIAEVHRRKRAPLECIGILLEGSELLVEPRRAMYYRPGNDYFQAYSDEELAMIDKAMALIRGLAEEYDRAMHGHVEETPEMAAFLDSSPLRLKWVSSTGYDYGTRVESACWVLGCETVRDFLSMPLRTVFRVRNFGWKARQCMEDVMARHGVRWPRQGTTRYELTK